MTDTSAGGALDQWLEALAREFNVEPDGADVQLLLDVARDAAHGVARPAAPIATFMLGFVLASRGGGAAALRDAGATVSRLAAQWEHA